MKWIHEQRQLYTKALWCSWSAFTWWENWIWCAISAHRIIQPTFFCRNDKFWMLCEVNSETLFNQLTEEETVCRYFTWDNSTAYGANNINELSEGFSKQVISCAFSWFKSNFYLWGTLKDKVCVNNLHSLQNWWGKFYKKFCLCPVNNSVICRNTFLRCETCKAAEGWHFKTLL
jgi:hypothetical protein